MNFTRRLQQDVEKCEACGHPSVVIDSRPDEAGHRRRRRKCLNCSTRWTTYESRVHPRKFAAVEAAAREIISTTTSSV